MADVLTDNDLKDYAEHILLSQTEDVEFLTVWEMWESYSHAPKGRELTRGEESRIYELLQKARVTVSWEDDEPLG